ncbi:hypothetical protein TNCT6_76880 [Streptomyces sp. 6-11-2]|nr:hypothetical protein TNCT6_76880 [Streptomyces sp. 6-11-2]
MEVPAFPQEQFGLLLLGHHSPAVRSIAAKPRPVQNPGGTPASSCAARSGLPVGRWPSLTITLRKKYGQPPGPTWALLSIRPWKPTRDQRRSLTQGASRLLRH